MATDLNVLINAHTYRAFDVDDHGRVLIGTDESGSVQLAEVTPDGTVTVLTALPGPCSGRYVPGQRAVIVSHDNGGDERHQISLLGIPAEPVTAGLSDLEPLVSDPRFIHNLADVTGDKVCYLTNRRDGVAFDPVIRDLVSGAERTLRLGDHMFSEARLSPDGRWLAVLVSSPVTAHSEHVALVDLAGAETLVPVTTPDALAWNTALCWTPDSAALVYSSNNDREFSAVARFDLATRTRTWLVTDDAADLVGWLSPDGRLLLVERNDDGASAVAMHDAATGQWLRGVPLPEPGCVRDVRVPSPVWARDSEAVFITLTGPQVPGDVLMAGGASRVRELTHSVDSLGETALAAPEPHRVPAAGGELVPCMVYRPVDQGTPVAGSAVVLVHGGPEAQARQRFDVYVQALVAAGHTVLVPNVRGSAGYGKRWYSADDGRRRLDSVADLAALHAYLPKLGLDQSRAALWGGSYGGYMVLAGLAFQPELWAAGVDIVGIASLVTFLENTSAYRRAYREREYGTLAHDREFLHEASPLTRVDQITAPLFIIHGANDPRVPLSEAEQIHAALTDRGRECELLVYPDEGHGLAKRANRADALPKAIAFLARHLAQ
jgi:dipeptidyl aminopeptidase/acylaminoacyl peptidase